MADPYQALRFPDFRWLLAGSTGLFMAAQIQTSVMGYQVYRITQDPFSLGLIGLSEAVPFLGLSLIGGHVADRLDRRRVSLAAMAILFAGALLLLALNLPEALAVAWPFYAVQAVNGFFIGSSNEVGAFESGLAARLLGVVPSVVFGGLVTLGVVGTTAWRVPELRRLKRIA